MSKSNAPTLRLVTKLQSRGYKVVAGVDEVGRGSLAGPLVAAAVVLAPKTPSLEAVRDSKQLSSRQRAQLSRAIQTQALAIGIGWTAADEIDSLGLSRSLALAGHRALKDINISVDCVVLDGNLNYLNGHVDAVTEIGADAHCLPVACASIVAKVSRDNYMRRMADLLPAYGLERNMGYGTATHRQALAQCGPSWLHRRSFEPLKSTLKS